MVVLADCLAMAAPPFQCAERVRTQGMAHNLHAQVQLVQIMMHVIFSLPELPVALRLVSFLFWTKA